MNKNELISKFYTNKIQLSLKVIDDILDNCYDKKMLVFGLGYDSKLWYNATKGNTFFVENIREYINLNKDIPKENILHYEYKNITVQKSFNISESDIEKYKIPDELLKWGKFDVIIIDGPQGWNLNNPGRLLPIYWSKKYLSKTGTIIYVDDYDRKLESELVKKYYNDNINTKIHRDQNGKNAPSDCIKIII